jgi:hypothetical protein
MLNVRGFRVDLFSNDSYRNCQVKKTSPFQVNIGCRCIICMQKLNLKGLEDGGSDKFENKWAASGSEGYRAT